MITSAHIKEMLERRPFRPFRIFLSDGSHHEVPHPEFAWVFGGRIFIGVSAKGASGLDGLAKELAILHITRVEEKAPPHKPRRRSPSR